MKNLVHGIKEKTPMGFCDVPRKNLFDFLHDMKSISVSNEPRYKPLIKIHQAASEGDAERLQRMISLGKHSVHDRDCKQRTALHYACAYGQVEVVNFLLKNNCDVDAIDMNSVTPLMKAVQNWTYECVCTLLKHGADPNHMDKDGNTSLHYAVSEGNQILAKCLLKYSADMEQKNKDGFTPLLQALKENKIEMAKFLVMNGANIHVFDYMKRNTLLYAIRWNSKDMVSLLLNEGIDVFFKDVFGWTALRYAIEGTSKGIREILTDYDEKLRVKHKNGNSAYKNSEDNSLAKYPNGPTLGSNLPKSKEENSGFNDKLSSSKYAPDKCSSNLCGAGDQRIKNEMKGTMEDSSEKHPASKPVAEKADFVAYEKSVTNQEASANAESDIFTTESQEENVSEDSENIQALRGEGLLSGKNHERRNVKAQVWMHPTLKSSVEGKVPILKEARKTAKSYHFLIESDLEIESLEETLSDENEDKQSLSADGDFSWTTEESGQKHKSRQNTDSPDKHPEPKPTSENADFVTHEESDTNQEDSSNTGNLEEQAIELTLEEEQKKNNSSENSQCLSIFKLHQPKQIGSIFVTRDNHEENTINGEEKELSKEYPQKKSTTEEETVPNDSPDKKKAKSLQTDCSEESSQCEANTEKKESDSSGKSSMKNVKYLCKKDLKMKREEYLDGDENGESTDTSTHIQPRYISQLSLTLTPTPTNILNGEKGFQKKFPEWKPIQLPVEMKHSDPLETSAVMHRQVFPEDEDFKLETESKDYSECSENTQSSNSIMCLQSKYVPHFSVGVNSRSTNHLIVGEKVFPRIDPEYKNNQSPIGSKAFVSSEVSTVKHEHEFLPEKDLQLKMENLKYLDGDENTQLSDIVTHIQLRCNPHLSTGLSPRPMSILNERGKGFCVIYRQRKPPIVKRGSVPTDPSPAVKCGQEFPSEEDSKMETDDFQELLDDNESIQSYNSAMCLQPGTSPYLSLGLTQKPMNLSNEGGKEVNMQMKADNNFKNVEEIGSTQSSGTMADLQQWHTPHLPVQPISTPRNLQNKGQKVYQIHKQSTEPGLQKKSVKNQDNLEINKNTQLSDNVMDLQPRKILHSSTALSPRFIDLNAGGETKLQMKSEENQKHNDGNENIQSSDSLTHPQPIQISHLLMGLIPRPVNIKSRPGKESQKKHPSLKDSTEIKVDTDATLERKEMQTIKPVILEDDQDKCDASQNNRPLVSGNSKGHTSNEKEDALHSCGCAAASAAPDVSEASVVAAIVAAVIVATPAAAATAASAAVAAVMAAVAPAVTAAASAAAAIDALAAVAPGAAPDISAVPVAAATAATAAAVPAAAAATPDTAPATVAAAAAAAAAATVAVASVAAASLTAASASVAAVVAATVTAAAGSEAPTVAPAAAAAVAAATSPAAAAALVASLAATAAPWSPPPVTMSPAAPSTVAAATAAAAALATHAAASPAVAAAAAAAVAISTIVPQGAPAVATAAAAAAAVAAADPPDACPDAHPAAPATVTKRLILQRKNVEARKQQPPFEEAEEHDRSKKKISKEKVEVLKPVKDTCDLNALTPINESCSEKYIGNSLKSTPVFDSHKELIELKEINVQILTEKTKVENELSEVKEENSQLKKKLVKKNEKIFKLRSMIKEQAEKKRNIICAYNEIVDELREKEEMMERRGEQYNRQVTETHELEVCLKTRDVELKQLQKEKEHAQKMDDHLQVLELENTSLIATVKKQKENIEHLQRHLQDTHKDVVQSSNLENKNLCKKHASVIHEMENTMRTLKSEVSSVKTSNESNKSELEKYKQYYLEELRNKNFLLHELNRIGKPFKMINPEHEIGECGSHGDFETCQFGTNMPVSMLQCSAQSTAKPYSELRESNTTSTINEMETKIRSLNSTLSKLKVRTASKGLELERFKHLYLEELSIRKSFQNYLNKNQQPAIFPLTDIK